MSILIEFILPFILIIGFLSYFLKVYYHFLYLKKIKNYPENIGILNNHGFSIVYLADRLETILPFLLKRDKIKFKDDDRIALEHLEKRIFICIIIFIIGMCSIPLGIYLLNNNSN